MKALCLHLGLGLAGCARHVLEESDELIAGKWHTLHSAPGGVKTPMQNRRWLIFQTRSVC